MSNDLSSLGFLENLWKSGDVTAVKSTLPSVLEEASGSLNDAIECGRLLMKMKQFWSAVNLLKAASSDFPGDYRTPELLVDACFQIGDADGALDAYSKALTWGLPAQTEAVRRVTRVAVWCGRFEELEPLLGDPQSAPFQAECRAMFEREKIAFDRFEAKRISELADTMPDVEAIRRAHLAGDLPYATHLYLAATRSPQIDEKDLLAVIYKSSPPSGHVAIILAFAAWNLMRRFPDSPLGRLEVGVSGLLQFGDAIGASEMLNEVLQRPECLAFPGAADRLIKLATSCSVFGALPPRRLAEICGAFWYLLSKRDYTILASGFAARASEPPVRRSAGQNLTVPPRVAICVSGQLRDYRYSWPSMRQAVQSLGADVFLSTWNRVGAGLGTGDSIGRKLPAELRERLAGSFQDRRLFAERYPSTFELFARSAPVLEGECKSFFGAECVRVNDEAAFEKAHEGRIGLHNAGNLNQAKMYFGIHDAIRLKSEHASKRGIKYDVVIRMRPDLSVRSIGNSDLELAANGRVALSTHLRLNATGDVLMLMSSEVADIVGAMWPAMEKANSFAIVPGASGAAAETALFETLCWNGVHVRQLGETQALSLNSLQVTLPEFRIAISADLERREELDHIDLIIASAVSEASGCPSITSISDIKTAIGSIHS